MFYPAQQIIDLIKENESKIVLPNNREVKVSKSLRVFKKWGIICARCGLVGEIFKESKSKHRSHLRLFGKKDGQYVLMNIDHIIPVSKGGSSYIENLQTTCEVCNTKKGDDVVFDYDEIKYSLRSVKDYIVSNNILKYVKPQLRKTIIEDFHNTIRASGIDESDYLLKVSFDEAAQFISHIKDKYNFDIPFSFITKVPTNR